MGYPHHIIQRGQLTGSARFVEEIDQKTKGGWSSDGREGQENRINKSVPFIAPCKSSDDIVESYP